MGTITASGKYFRNKIFWLCSAIVSAAMLIFVISMIFFVNKMINLLLFCVIICFTLSGAITFLYFLLKKIFTPVKIQSKRSQQIEAVGYLAGGFVHEYNNMFAAILGAGEILQRSVSKENREYVDIITGMTKRASLLTNRLFGSARKKKIEMVTVDMHQMLSSVIQILQKNRTSNIHFLEDFQADSWNIAGNRQQIKNALINLGINAVEAIGTKDGTVYFRTRTEQFTEETNIGIFVLEAGKYLTISIEDTGDGFSPEQMERIYDPYFSTAQNKGDLGIRLASALATVSHHNGAILAKSKEYYGTTFTIYLPFSERKFETTKTLDLEKVRLAKSDSEVKQKQILVVDDDPFVRKIVAVMLNRIGYSVIEAESGVDALEIYKEQQNEISLVILDMVMPNMDGVSCFYELKKINPAVKVLVSSGYIDNSNIDDMKKDGLCGFISKPYSYDELEKTVVNVLQV